jgi:branched-subunit amino acid transport protein AzlD
MLGTLEYVLIGAAVLNYLIFYLRKKQNGGKTSYVIPHITTLVIVAAMVLRRLVD